MGDSLGDNPWIRAPLVLLNHYCNLACQRKILNKLYQPCEYLSIRFFDKQIQSFCKISSKYVHYTVSLFDRQVQSKSKRLKFSDYYTVSLFDRQVQY